MRILCLIEHLGPGGAERQLSSLAVLLGRRHTVKVATYVDRPFYKTLLDANGIEYVCLTEARNKFRRIPIFRRLIREYRPDAVIAYMEGPGMLACLVRLTGAGRYRLIVSERNTTQRIRLYDRIRFALFRIADYIVPNSYSQEDFIRSQFPALASKLRTITNYVDLDTFRPAEIPFERNEPLHIVVAGRVTPQKNTLNFLDAVKKVTDAGHALRVSWYGDKRSEYYHQCVRKSAELALNSIVSFLDPTEKILSAYRQADLFCLPSIYEGFPNVLCEAMACGVPVLCSDVCDNPRIMREGENGFLFDPSDPDNIAESIIRFIRLSPEERNRMRTKSRELAEKRFSESGFINRYEELLK